MENGIRFIGDIHAEFELYLQNIHYSPYPTIQVGDYGIGFRQNPIITLSDAKNHRFIRGNHDDPGLCKSQSNWIEDGHIENGMMFIGGASSIDKAWRTEGVSWWPDEECSIEQLNHFIEIYEKEKPSVMVTHECPESIFEILITERNGRVFDVEERTRKAFQAMLDIHRPDLWIFGHHHYPFNKDILGTRFICLDCHQCVDYIKNND